MALLYLLCYLLFCVLRVSCFADCHDMKGRSIPHGLHYVPGPDSCNLCVCDNGQPKVCKLVLCSAPDCPSFRVGTSCCEFICLDDMVKPSIVMNTVDTGVKLMIGALSSMIIIGLVVLVYKFKGAKIHDNVGAEQRSLNSVGYISANVPYMSGTNETGASSWKPGSYLPRGEAPPPYDEVMAQARFENRLNTDPVYPRRYTVTVESMTRNDDSMQTGRPNYINVSRQLNQIPNQSHCLNAPLLQQIDGCETSIMPRRVLQHSAIKSAPNSFRLTGSLGTINNRNVLGTVSRETDDRPQNVPGFYANPKNTIHTSLHRTIPRISTSSDQSTETDILFSRRDQNEIRRSFHKPNEARTHIDTGRSMPKNLNLVAGLSIDQFRTTMIDDVDVNQALPLTIDKPSCVCSYNPSAPDAEETDDYRIECENCNAASRSMWSSTSKNEWTDASVATQSLQRHTPVALSHDTGTLPQPVTRTLKTPIQSAHWDNWIKAMPDTDSESEC